MKINDILNEELVEFIPLTKRARTMSKAQKAGKKDMIATADKLNREFAGYMGTQGKKLNQVVWQDIIDFLSYKKVDTSKLDTTAKPNLKKVFRDVAQKAMALPFKAPTPKKSAAPKATPKGNKVSNKPKVPANVVNVVSKMSDSEKVALAQAILKKYS
jgi:hypothetical protein